MGKTIKRKVLKRDDIGLCVLLPKTEWSRVPPPGGSFTGRVNGTERTIHVVGEQCTCGGRPVHEHRYLQLPKSVTLTPNDQAVVELF
ncbi:MAG: hypothetical protein ACLFVU_11315 [Phycisphaerae bacterium]